MSLRTYPLLVHPAFLAFIERQAGFERYANLQPSDVPPHLPVINDISDISEYLKISPSFIRSILIKPEKHYRRFKFKKRDGSFREIASPRTFLKVIQWWILDSLLYKAPLHHCVHGFVPHRSFISNAQRHVGAKHILNVDIKNFFPSIGHGRVLPIFRGLGYSEEVAARLVDLTTLDKTLPQGAPTSPMLANLHLTAFDQTLAEICLSKNLVYTRYADDLTISSQQFITSSLISEVENLLVNFGHTLNRDKTVFYGPNQRKEVTGLILGAEHVRLSPDFLNGSRGWFHRISLHPGSNVDKLEKVRGTLSLIRAVGGPASRRVIAIGEEAVRALQHAKTSLP